MILVTGANGFVGKVLCDRLSAHQYVRALVRATDASSTVRRPQTRIQWVSVSDLQNVTDWSAILREVSTVIHLAARTHVLRETDKDPLTSYRRINVQATEKLARACVGAGVKRLVFLSSIKVNGEFTTRRPFCEADEPSPTDAYGISKLEAELLLMQIGQESGLEIVTLRPPLVYGPGVKGNFLRLLAIARSGWPLPLASVRNLRSLIYVENLVDALVLCAIRKDAPGKTYLISDNEDVSTPQLVASLSSGMGAPAKLLPCPVSLLRGAAKLVGRSAEAARLLGSLQIDCSLFRTDMGWTPPFTVANGLDRTIQWYRDSGILN